MPFDGDFPRQPEPEASAPEFEASPGGIGAAALQAWCRLIRARHLGLLRGLDREQLALVGLSPADLAWLAANPSLPAGGFASPEPQTPSAAARSAKTIAG